MPPRFLLPGARPASSPLPFSDEEAEHALRVLRLSVGDRVRVFDGRGSEFEAEIVLADKRRVHVAIGASVPAAAELPVAVTLVQAVLKGDKMDDVVRDAVMMGVTTIVPLVTTRAETSLAALERGARRARWQRVALASTKQCGRAVLAEVAPPLPLEAWLSSAGPGDSRTLVCVEPGAGAHTTSLVDLAGHVPPAARVVVGPEGGWTPEELAQLAPLTEFVALGTRTLRADATAIVAMAALLSHWRAL